MLKWIYINVLWYLRKHFYNIHIIEVPINKVVNSYKGIYVY